MPATLDSTLALIAETGWRIFPSVNKFPAIKDWPNACSRDPDQIHQWWRRWPDARPSLVTGPRNGIVVLDIDVGTDKDGQPYSGFPALEDVFHWHETPETPCVHTPRGGMHLYFACERLPDEDTLNDEHPAHRGAILNSVSKLAPHIDVRGWNGFVVLPAFGTGYVVDPSLTLKTPMLRAPQWFNHRPRRQRETSADHGKFDPDVVLRDACQEIAQAREGSRHDTYRHTVFRIARLVGLGLIDRSRAYHNLMAECLALGTIADGHTRRVQKYFERSWDEGIAAGERRYGR